jgi:hypothetical protein
LTSPVIDAAQKLRPASHACPALFDNLTTLNPSRRVCTPDPAEETRITDVSVRDK